MDVIIDASEVHDLAGDIRRHAGEVPRKAELVVSKTGHDMQATAQVNCPVDTGLLRSSISLDMQGLGFELGPTVDYGGFVEEGTDGPYLIHNAFGWGITVEHPGNSPEPYLAPAFDHHLPQFEHAIASLGDGAVSNA